jgi:diguanylate cyclase (GGDEF)-like protein/putative nucleotidyltransferase with HDIG domain
MVNRKWNAEFALGAMVSTALLVLVLSFVSTLRLPFTAKSGLIPWLVLVILALAVSQFVVSITSTDGTNQSGKSVADALVLLAIILYGVPPASTAGPATLLAAVVSLVTTRRLRRQHALLATSIIVVSTFVAASCYGLLATAFAGADFNFNQSLPLDILLIPVCVLAFSQYLLITILTSSFTCLETGKLAGIPSTESVVWSLTTQLAGVSSAVLIYSAIHGAGVPYALLGLLITALVHMLYHFNEKRIEQVKRAEADQRRHIEEMATIHMNTIESLAIAIDAKDQTTHGHVRRTQIYASEMGKLFSVTPAEVQALFAGALLHDIGKLAVPEYILNKPGKLTEAEFAKMKIHPTVGGDILRRVNFPYPVEDIVRYHHEKWDGTGYPKGLRGEAIPLVARIISVVDFYDATRCDRPYRKGMTREESVALLRSMSGNAFDPRVVAKFINHVEMFDRMIASEDIREQVAAKRPESDYLTTTKPDAGLAANELGTPNDTDGFSSITEAQREVFALHEIAQTIGSSLNLNDTVTLVSTKLSAIVPFDTCIIFVVDEKSGKATATHVVGENADIFARRRINVGDGITGWVIANKRSMCNASPDLDLVGIPDDIAEQYRGVLVTPLLREDGAFGAISLYSKSRTSYTSEHVRLLESVSQHASSALNNALTFEKTKESALIDPLTELPNARGFYMMLEQRIAEGQRMGRESLAVMSMDLDDFKNINDKFSHAIGDRVLASISGVIRKELRQMDILTRYAGDEFVAIMPMASVAVAGVIAERVRQAVENQNFSVRTGRTVRVGVSVGVACFPDDGETTEQLLTEAARRMQRDKHRRKSVLTLANTPVATIETLR